MFQQVGFSQGGITATKLTRAFTVDRTGKDLFGSLGAVGSFTYHDPDTDDPVKVMVGVDPLWNRIVWSTTYQGETGVKAMGSFGAGTNQMDTPSDLALASNGSLYVADTGNHRVKVFGWIADNGVPSAERFFTQLYSIPGGSDFTAPHQVLWDDNGTRSVSTDDILWVLDRSEAVIVGYHITYSGYSRYVRLPLKQIFRGPASRHILSFTKARTYDAAFPSEYTTTCTEDLIAYDSVSDSLLRFTIPRTAGEVLSPETQVIFTVKPNPLPGVAYPRLATDPWGNIVGVDQTGSRLVKLDRSLQFVATFGTRGKGGLGTNEMFEPISLMYHIDKPVPGSATYGLSRDVLLGEEWGDLTGVQGLRVKLEMGPLDVAIPSGSDQVRIGVTPSDDGKLRVRILDLQTGAEIRTVQDQPAGAGRSDIPWDGRDNAGAIARRCASYIAEARVISFYAPPETVVATAAFYYKPPVRATLTIGTSTPGSRFAFDGRDTVLAGTSAVFPCSVCTVHSPTAPATQTIGGVRYCFDRWSNGGARTYHNVQVLGDSTITLYLTAGPGPTTIPAGATVYDDAYDCKSPYVFQGSATLATSNPADTFRTWGNVKFRFPKNVSASLVLNRPMIAKGARFELTDTTAAAGNDSWEGIRLGSYTALLLDSCQILRAKGGIRNATGAQPVAALSVTRSTFQSVGTTPADISLNFDHALNPFATLSRNRFSTSLAVSLTLKGNTTSPLGNATITHNFFPSADLNGSLRLEGGWQGQVERDTFTVNNNGAVGVMLVKSATTGLSPSVNVVYSRFSIVSNQGKRGLVAPARTSTVTSITAVYNDWNYYTREAIEGLVDHQVDNSDKAYVFFEPWYQPGGGGGGGGGGGCPFVLVEKSGGLTVENSILGRAEHSSGREFVADAYPVRDATPSTSARLKIRVAELESDTDELDEIRLGSVGVPEGWGLASTPSGRAVITRPIGTSFQAKAWTGKHPPFISPVAPVDAYRGEPGDSLEYEVPNDGTIVVKDRRVGIQMIPKPTEVAPVPGGSRGVTVRVSPDSEGERWITLDPVTPREYWSTDALPLDAVGGEAIRRVRLIWQTRHTLGWIGLVESQDVEPRLLRCLTAAHSGGSDVRAALASRDGRNVTLKPGEHVELEFDARDVPDGSRYVLLAYGRYYRGAPEAPSVPSVPFLGQNRPNPFNPETVIDFGLPATSHATLRIYDVGGRLVRGLLDATLPAGYHRAEWDGRNRAGVEASSGVYFYELRAGLFSERRRMVLIR